MIFHTYTPKHPILRQQVRLLWYISQPQHEVMHIDARMLPDGYYHMVINLGSPHTFIDKKGNETALQMSHMNANQYEYMRITRSGAVEVMGIIFRPYGLAALLRTSIHEVSGSVWNMEDLLGNPLKGMEEQLLHEANVAGKFIVLENELVAIMKDPMPIKAEIKFAVDILIKNKGLMNIQQLSDYTQISERSLERHFNQFVGMSPKHFARLQRLQYVLKQMKKTNNRDLVTMAVQSGYYDQSHFSKEFVSLTGMTPISYYHNSDLLSKLYVQ